MWKPLLIYLLFSAVGLAIKIFPPLNIKLDQDRLFDDIYDNLQIQLPTSTSAIISGPPPTRAMRISSLRDVLQVTSDGTKKLIEFMVGDLHEIHTIGNFGIQAAWEQHMIMGVASKKKLNPIYEHLENWRMETLDHTKWYHHKHPSWRESKITALSVLKPTSEAVSLAVNLHTLLIAWRTYHYYRSLTRELVMVRNFHPTRYERMLGFSINLPTAVSRNLLRFIASSDVPIPNSTGPTQYPSEDLMKNLQFVSPHPPYLKKFNKIRVNANMRYWYQRTMMVLLTDCSIQMAYHAKAENLCTNWDGLRNVFKDQDDLLFFLDIYKEHIDHFLETRKWDNLLEYDEIMQRSCDKYKLFVKEKSNQLFRSSTHNVKPIDKTNLPNFIERLQLQAPQIALQNVGVAINYVNEFLQRIRGQKDDIFIPEPRPRKEAIYDLVYSASRLFAITDAFLVPPLRPRSKPASWLSEKLWGLIVDFITLIDHIDRSKPQRQKNSSNLSISVSNQSLKEAKSKLHEKETPQDPQSDAATQQSTYNSAVNCALEDLGKTSLLYMESPSILSYPQYSEILVQAVQTLFSSVSATQADIIIKRIKESVNEAQHESLVFRIYYYISELNPDQRLDVFERIEKKLKGREQTSSASHDNVQKLSSLYQLIKTNSQGPSMPEWREEIVHQDPQCPIEEIEVLWNIVEEEADRYLLQPAESDFSSRSAPGLLSLTRRKQQIFIEMKSAARSLSQK